MMSRVEEMAQEQKVQQIDQLNDTEEYEVEYIEVDPQSYGRIYNFIYKAVQFAASTFLGLFFIEKLSHGLEVIEKTAKWSLPRIGENTQIALERPLSWLPFIALIIILKIIKTALSIASILIGNSPVQTRDIIYFLQTRRRKLRALRNQSCRSQNDSLLEHETSGDYLKKLMSNVSCHPMSENEESSELLTPLKFQTPISNQTDKSRKTLKRWSAEQCANETLSADQLLEKYASLDSDDDSDFLPEADLCSPTSSSANTTTNSCTDQSESNQDNSQSEIIEGMSPQKSKVSKKRDLVEIKENGDRLVSTPKQNSDSIPEKQNNSQMGNKTQRNISKNVYKKKAALNGSPLRAQSEKMKLSPVRESGAPKGESPDIHNTTFDYNSVLTQDDNSTLIAPKEGNINTQLEPNYLEAVNDIQLPTTKL